jgi:ATP-dependent helicase HrpA
MNPLVIACSAATATAAAPWREALQALESGLGACLLQDQYRLAERIRVLRRKLRGRGRKLRADYVERRLGEIRTELERSREVRTRRATLPLRLEFPSDLPFTAHAEAIAELVTRHQVVIVSGETGCGKSTQLPKLCLRLGRGVAGRIGHTQPRRIAARAIARRLAEETATVPGRAVGHCVRFDDNLEPVARVKLMTDGILLNEIHHDPRLTQYDTLIIDEVHERSLNVDFLIGYLKQVLAARPDLKLILTSATIDAGVFERFFDDAVSYVIPDRAYPIEIRYRPPPAEDEELDVDDAIVEAIRELDAEARGDVLVFLPGEREIREAAQRIGRAHFADTDIFTLYARLGAARQARIFEPGPRRRVILATNVAETSLTVPRVRHVVDTGLARISRYSPRRKLQQLPVEKIPQANADQRSGRCGRESAGICIRLYSEEDYLARRPRIEPEIQRTNLAGVVLKLKAMGIADVESFAFAEAPSIRLIKDAYLVLQEIGALDAGRELTALGAQLARFPIDPRLARVLDAASKLGCLTECLVIVAALSIADPRERPHEARDAADRAHAAFADKRSDFMWFLRAWPFAKELRLSPPKKQQRVCRRRFLSAARMAEWTQLHDTLSKLAADAALPRNPLPASYKCIHTALAAGFLSQVGEWQVDHYSGCRSMSFQLHPSSVLARRAAPWVVAAEVIETRERYARIAARIEPQWLEQVGQHLVKRNYEAPHWDVKRGCVRATEILRLYGLTISNARLVDYVRIDAQASRGIFIDSGLMAGELGEEVGFLGHNRALLARVRALEERARRRDLLVGAEQLHDFYEQRLPATIATRRDLLAWLREDPARGASLCMTEADITTEQFASVQAWLFPEQLSIGGTDCALAYRFEPGHVHDGVSVRLPLVLLTRLRPDDVDRLVPGMLSDKVAALLRAQPKARRRLVSPIREFAMACVEALAHLDGPLPVALATALERITGLPWPASSFDDAVLEPHQRMLLILLDDHGEVREETRDVARLLGVHGADARQHSAAVDWRLAGRSQSGWRFPRLPREVETDVGGTRLRGYPTLVDERDCVALKVLDDAAQAEALHRRGVARLLCLDAGSAIRQLTRGLAEARELGLLSALFGHQHPPPAALALGAARRLLAADDAPREANEYAALLSRFQARLASDIPSQAHGLLVLMRRAASMRVAIGKAPPASRDDLERQLKQLLGPLAMDHLDDAGLARVSRSLDAIARRLERVDSNPGKDLRKLESVEPLARRLQALQDAAGEQGPALRKLHLMLEDYRVSVFAPELGAPTRIVADDIAAALSLLEGGA